MSKVALKQLCYVSCDRVAHVGAIGPRIDHSRYLGSGSLENANDTKFCGRFVRSNSFTCLLNQLIQRWSIGIVTFAVRRLVSDSHVSLPVFPLTTNSLVMLTSTCMLNGIPSSVTISLKHASSASKTTTDVSTILLVTYWSSYEARDSFVKTSDGPFDVCLGLV